MENTIEFKAIGTHWWINIYDNLESNKLSLISNSVKDLTNNFENLYSRFITNSLVSRINNGEVLSVVPEDLSNMLNLSEKVKEISDGHFNINVGTTLENYGYDSEYSFKESFDITNKIDLGGIGKGYLIDLVSEFLNKEDIKYYFINAGGDIFATSNMESPIEFILESPFKKDQSIGVIRIKNQSIGASSALLRKWKTQNTNKEVHHLIDYKSKEPVNNIAGVFTLSHKAVFADLASTALFVSPVELHSQIAKELKTEYLIVFADGTYKISNNYPGLLN